MKYAIVKNRKIVKLKWHFSNGAHVSKDDNLYTVAEPVSEFPDGVYQMRGNHFLPYVVLQNNRNPFDVVITLRIVPVGDEDELYTLKPKPRQRSVLCCR